jgi:hypothetical protein
METTPDLKVIRAGSSRGWFSQRLLAAGLLRFETVFDQLSQE